MANKKLETNPVSITINPLSLRKADVEIESFPGSSFLCQKLDDKAKQAIEKKKFPDLIPEVIPYKNKEEELEAKLHLNEKGEICFPKGGFTGGMQECANELGLVKKKVKGIKILGPDLVPIKSTDFIENDTFTGGFRQTPRRCLRPEFKSWTAKFTIVYNENLFTLETIIKLINMAGFECGIGSWAPHCPAGGEHGMYRVKLTKSKNKSHE